MSTISHESLAGLRLLIAMAKADGTMTADERYALEDALAGVTLPEDLTVEMLLNETNDFRQLARQIASRDGRDYTYACVFSVAYCDRKLHEAENKLLAILRQEWGLAEAEDDALERTLASGMHPVPEGAAAPAEVSPAQPGLPPAEREEQFNRLLQRYCLLTGMTGAIPVPLLPDVMVVPMQVALVYQIANLFGQKTDRPTVQLMFETLGVGTGARLGISALCKLVPGWGSVVGATTSFATTYALGTVAHAYFQSEGRKSLESLKPLYRDAKEDGKREYQKHKDALAEAAKTHEKTLSTLAHQLQRGQITQAEYEQRLDQL